MSDVTRLLDAAAAGDRQAADDLFQIVYEDLRRLARRYLDGERPGQTFQPTARVHEACLRLLGEGTSTESGPPAGRAPFFAASARAMRHILIEAARRKQSAKRGGRVRKVLDPERIAEPQIADDLLALHGALDALAAVEPTIAELVTLRYFAGLTLKEGADQLGIAPRTADADWACARVWLAEAIAGPDD